MPFEPRSSPLDEVLNPVLKMMPEFPEGRTAIGDFHIEDVETVFLDLVEGRSIKQIAKARNFPVSRLYTNFIGEGKYPYLKAVYKAALAIRAQHRLSEIAELAERAKDPMDKEEAAAAKIRLRALEVLLEKENPVPRNSDGERPQTIQQVWVTVPPKEVVTIDGSP